MSLLDLRNLRHEVRILAALQRKFSARFGGFHLLGVFKLKNENLSYRIKRP